MLLAMFQTKFETAAQSTDKIVIPAYTAYAEPDETGVEVDENKGIINWQSSDVVLKCFFNLVSAGKLKIALNVNNSEECTINTTVNGADFKLKIGKASGEQTIEVGTVEIASPGYYSITLSGVSKKGEVFPHVNSFILSGEAATGVHFNKQSRRNAASVHLRYPFANDVKAEWFYNEVTVPEGFDPVHTFYMANGFKRGYFGIQVNSKTERRVIFSVWDSGNEAEDRNQVGDENKVKLLNKGEGVVAGDFGNEGTGGHSHWVYNWQTGGTYRFLLRANPEESATVYTAWFYLNDKKEWKLIASFLAPKDGNYLKNLHSFTENFWGANGQKMRKAYYGPQWIKNADGEWTELVNSVFTHDPTGKEERKDNGAGVDNGRFYMFTGGFVQGTAKYGDTFSRPATNRKPEIELPGN